MLLISITTSTISVWLALKKYRSEKWWDKKLECYQQTLEAMNKIINFCDKYIAEECCSKEFPDEEINQLKQEFYDGKKLLETQANIGELMLAVQAHKIVLHLGGLLYEIDLSFDSQQIAELREETNDYLSDFIEIAQADLGIKNFATKIKEFLFKKFGTIVK